MPGQWADSDRRSRLPANWSAICKAVLARDRGICHVCKRGGADGVDHVVPGDDHSMENLKAIHHHMPPYCHRAKSSREGGQAAARNRRIQTQRRMEPHPAYRHS